MLPVSSGVARVITALPLPEVRQHTVCPHPLSVVRRPLMDRGTVEPQVLKFGSDTLHSQCM